MQRPAYDKFSAINNTQIGVTVVGAALTPLNPRIAGTVEHYAVTPALPLGVVLDSTSGVITGTPSVARALAPYTITASSLAGSTSFILLLVVAAPAPRSSQ